MDLDAALRPHTDTVRAEGRRIMDWKNAGDSRAPERVERDRWPRGDAVAVLEHSPAVPVGLGAGVDVPAGARYDGARAKPHPVVRVRLCLGAERDAARDGQLAGLVQRDHERSRGAIGLLSSRGAQV